MHSALRPIAWFVIGLIVGVAATIPAFLFYLRTESGNTIVRNYLASPPQWAGVDLSKAALPLGTAVPDVSLLVPKEDASREYANALTGAVGSINTIGSLYAELLPVFQEINTKAVSRNYGNFFALVLKAQGLLDKQKGQASVFAQNINKLSAANQSTTDTVTKSLTQDFITKGTAVHAALETYLASLELLISGPLPTEEQLSQVFAEGAAVDSASRAFNGAAQTLFAQLGERVLEAQP